MFLLVSRQTYAFCTQTFISVHHTDAMRAFEIYSRGRSDYSNYDLYEVEPDPDGVERLFVFKYYQRRIPKMTSVPPSRWTRLVARLPHNAKWIPSLRAWRTHGGFYYWSVSFKVISHVASTWKEV